MGEATVTFHIEPEHIGVVPEGGVALTAIRGELGDEDLSLIVDMGQVTTDIAIYRGRVLYGDKVISSAYAGSTFSSLVRGALTDEGYRLNELQVQRVLETGKVHCGASDNDVTDLIAAQKSAFVQNFLRGEIISILSMNGINALQIQNFIPIGAAMNGAEKEGSMVREIAVSCGLTNAAVRILSKDLRYVNVEQTAMFAGMMLKKAMKTKA